ncbi:MAG: ABC transporter ATP-binding protein [Minisyncoccia bacterium]
MNITLRTLWNTFRGYRWHIVALVVFGFLGAILEGIGINAVIPLMSFFTGNGAGAATDTITNAIRGLFTFFSIPFTFRYLLAFILVLFILRAISTVVFGYIRGWISADFLARESEDILGRALSASWPFSLKQKIGTIQNTLIRDIQQTGALLGSVAQSVQSYSGFLMYFLVAINISPTMTFYTLGGGAVLIFALRPFLRRAQLLGQEVAGVEKQYSQFLSEHLTGMKSVKAAGMEHAALASGDRHIQSLRRLGVRQALIRSVGTSFFQPASIVLIVVLFLLTYRLQTFSIISFVASLYLIQKIFTYLESGQVAVQSMSELLPYAQNIAAFKRSFDLHRESSEGDAPFVFERELTFKEVSFAYLDDKLVLDKVNFSIRAGETVGLVGPSGAGKTSVADLCLRLFKPDAGELLLDGVSSTNIKLESWRRHIGYVSQEAFLLNGTIEENIRFYNESLSREDIERAARQANIYDFIDSLPEGFSTITGDRGVMLSGGQRQRVALARALAGSPALLILDEATSALDHESEKLIHASIRALRGKVAVLIIAHRPSTVSDADTILVLNHGHILEQGTPHKLMANRESYFYKMQQNI